MKCLFPQEHSNRTIKKVNCIFLLLLFLLFTACHKDVPVVNNVPISINSDHSNLCNVQQRNTKIRMQSVAQELFVYLPASSGISEPLIIRFNQNGASKEEDILFYDQSKQLWNDSVVGFSSGYLYIKSYPEKEFEYGYPKKAELICYDLVTENYNVLVSTDKAAYMDIQYDENGNLYVSTREMSVGDADQYQMIKGNSLCPNESSWQHGTESRTTSKIIQKYNSIFPMLSENQIKIVIESLTELGLENQACSVFPCKSDWLLHMPNCKIPLCLISSDGLVTPIVQYDCYASSSSFNYFGDYAFLSVIRYEKWDEPTGYFMKTYENDSISGTYRINLSDYSVTKINDTYYCGIFIFDETHIFVCDQSNGVYQIDSDGNLIMTLIEPTIQHS